LEGGVTPCNRDVLAAGGMDPGRAGFACTDQDVAASNDSTPNENVGAVPCLRPLRFTGFPCSFG
jgi:hypothetical protein